MRKIFLDEIPYSKANYQIAFGVDHRVLDEKYNEYIKLFPKENAIQRAVEATTYFLDHSMMRGMITNYETEILDDAVAFELELVSDGRIVIAFGIEKDEIK